MTQDDAESYIAANRARLRPELRVNCPKRGCLVAAVYSTPWGHYLWFRPATMTPGAQRDALEIFPADDPAATLAHARETLASLATSGLLADVAKPSIFSKRCGCRCAAWRVRPEEVAAALNGRQRVLTLSPDAAWRGNRR